MLLFQVILFLALAAALYFLIRPVIRGAMYFPTPPEVVSGVVRLAKPRRGESALDIGSGDGRLIIALAKAGAKAVGCEINPLLIWKSRAAIKKSGLAKEASVAWRDFWREDFSRYDILVVFGRTAIMADLSVKFAAEAKPGVRIVSVVYPLPGWQPTAREKIGKYSIYLYVKP